jgi:hypothetical protein
VGVVRCARALEHLSELELRGCAKARKLILGMPQSSRQSARQSRHPMVAPRPTAAFGLFAVSLAGSALMLWGIDRLIFSVILVGWGISFVAGILIIWIYLGDIRQINTIRTWPKGIRAELSVAAALICIDLFLPPFLYSLIQREAKVDIIRSVVVLNHAPDNPFFVNDFLVNTGDLAALGLRRSFKFIPENHLLTVDEENDIMNEVIKKTGPFDISGMSDQLQPNVATVPSFPYPLTQKELNNIISGMEYLYLFVYFEYSDITLSYGYARITEGCQYFYKKFVLEETCHDHNRFYTTKIY